MIFFIFAIPAVMYLGFPLPLMIMKALIPKAILDAGSGGCGFLYYIWFLIAGFIIFSSNRPQQQIIIQRWVSLLLGVGLSTAYLFQLFSPSRLVLPGQITDWINTFLSFTSAWCWLFAILGFSLGPSGWPDRNPNP